jgi:phosphatidylglycerophosphate synthase
MLDAIAIKLVKKPLNIAAGIFKQAGINKDAVTIAGFVLGLIAIILLAFNLYIPALIFILLNRIFDGLDGALARITRTTDSGGFLDITLDFIFYSGIVFGFALANPEKNAIAAGLLLVSFMGTGGSFLAFSVLAEKNSIKSVKYPNKSLYYLEGLMEGTETIVFFSLFCIFPDFFCGLAVLFSILCWITTILRIIFGYKTLSD